MYNVVLFWGGGKREFNTAYLCQDLEQLDDFFGHPPPHSRGLYYAVQTLLFKQQLIFFRVLEEGFSIQDYLTGVRLLEQQTFFSHLDVIGVPGVGDPVVLNALQPLCMQYHTLLLTNEADFYDYLTFYR